MFSPATRCSGPPAPFGLRDDDDVDEVLICKAHYGRLRRLDERTLETYGRHLARAFAAKRAAQRGPEPERETPPRLRMLG